MVTSIYYAVLAMLSTQNNLNMISFLQAQAVPGQKPSVLMANRWNQRQRKRVDTKQRAGIARNAKGWFKKQLVAKEGHPRVPAADRRGMKRRRKQCRVKVFTRKEWGHRLFKLRTLPLWQEYYTLPFN